MKRYGTELEFIGQIRSDGDKILAPPKEDWLFKSLYELRPLSVSKGTYLAFNTSTYIVKLKNPPNDL